MAIAMSLDDSIEHIGILCDEGEIIEVVLMEKDGHIDMCIFLCTEAILIDSLVWMFLLCDMICSWIQDIIYTNAVLPYRTDDIEKI